jgi:hypothetical protein
MRSERIRALPSWRNGPSRYDTVLVSTDRQLEGMIGLDVARVRLFFSFTHEDIEYPCALINWYNCVSNSQDEDTCEELTTYETREVVAVPNSRSRGGV